MARLQGLNYRSVLYDIFDSEEFKVDLKYTDKLKKTVQQICEDGDREFEKCHEWVQKGRRSCSGNIRSKQKGAAILQGYVFVCS